MSCSISQACPIKLIIQRWLVFKLNGRPIKLIGQCRPIKSKVCVIYAYICYYIVLLWKLCNDDPYTLICYL